MDRFVIRGQRRLEGTVKIQGAKNAVLPMMAASLLMTSGKLVLSNVPDLVDVRTMQDILRVLGVESSFSGGTITLEVTDESKCKAPYELVKKMRASFLVLGPLLTKRKRAEVSYPGGCVIGVRPVDLHLKGLAALGAHIEIKRGYVVATAEKKLRGKLVYIGGTAGPTVTGTENMIMAAVLAEGTTILEYAACEPEVQDLCALLNKMGAKIEGIGSNRLVIHGVKELRGTKHSVISDRIEASTFLIAAAITDGKVTVEGCNPDHLTSTLETLRNCNVHISTNGDGSLTSQRKSRRLLPGAIVTQPHPGFPTDVQAQMMSLFCYSDGISVIEENIFPDRFMHVAELLRMGANLRRNGNTVYIKGPTILQGANVMASDLRASAGLILAALAAEGETTIDRVYHIDRGYDRIELKLRALGADIERVKTHLRHTN